MITASLAKLAMRKKATLLLNLISAVATTKVKA
jgi:hypothetical protein